MNTMPYSHKGELINHLESMRTSDDNIDDVMDSFREAQTFRLPHQESLPTVKDYKLFYEFMMPPYPVFLIEMPTDDGWLVMYIRSHKDIHNSISEYNEAIEEYNETTRRKWWQFAKKEISKKEKKSHKDISSISTAMFFKNHNGDWTSWSSFDISMDETGYEVKNEKDSIGKDEKKLGDEVLERFAWTIFEFMVAVNTPNIKQSEVKPPKLINAKRKKKGKPLLEGYKYLDLIPREQLDHDPTGAGATKRMHWRRGHIRRLTDRTTWVRPALIGNQGFIDKTYRLK